MFFELAPDVVVRGHVLPPPLACSHTNDGLNERTFDASQARPVVLDLREHAFIDGRGRHAIACAGSRARQAGRQLVLVARALRFTLPRTRQSTNQSNVG